MGVKGQIRAASEGALNYAQLKGDMKHYLVYTISCLKFCEWVEQYHSQLLKTPFLRRPLRFPETYVMRPWPRWKGAEY